MIYEDLGEVRVKRAEKYGDSEGKGNRGSGCKSPVPE